MDTLLSGHPAKWIIELVQPPFQSYRSAIALGLLWLWLLGILWKILGSVVVIEHGEPL